MANEKITSLASQTTLLGTDLFVMVDTTDTSMAPTGTDKNISATNIIAGVKTALITIPNTLVPFGNSSSNLTTDANLNYTSSVLDAPTVNVKVGLKLEDTGAGTNTVLLQAPTPLSASYTLTMPTAVGTTGQLMALADNGGTLTFVANASGDVAGPGSSTDKAVMRFNGTTGKIAQNSVAILSDAGALSGLTQLNVGNIQALTNTISSTNSNGNINLSPNGTGTVVVSSALESNVGVIYKQTSAGVNAITVQAPSTLAGAFSITLPPTAGLTNQVLQLTSPGVTTWSSVGSGDVDGPASSVAGNVPQFADTTGKLLQDSGVTVTSGATNAIGIGGAVTASGVSAISIGVASTASIVNGLALGAGSTASTGVAPIAIGLNSRATGDTSIAIGSSAKAVGANSIAIGQSTMSTAGGSDDAVAIGVLALRDLTAAGTNNIGIGGQAGALLTTGSQNVIMGTFALDSSGVDISDVVVVGYNALGANTTSAVNGTVAIGSGAAGAVTTGGGNLFIGFNAGSTVTTASDNTIIGHGASGNTTNGSNTIIGQNAGNAAMTNANTAVGRIALSQAGACSSQTAIGNNAMGGGAVSATGASASVAVGGSALNSLSTGSVNVAVGISAGGAITTGSNNTLVGGNTVSAATVSNNTIVGAAATAVTFAGCTLVGANATASADNQFVVNLANTTSPSTLVSTLVPTIATTASIGTNSFITVILGGSSFKIPLFT